MIRPRRVHPIAPMPASLNALVLGVGEKLVGPLERGVRTAEAEIEDPKRKPVALRARDRAVELAIPVIVGGEPVAVGGRLGRRSAAGPLAAEEDLQQADV